MLDEALLRRFDFSIGFNLPTEKEIKELVLLTLKNGNFSFDSKIKANKVIKNSVGLSYYSIQKTLVTAIKRSLFAMSNPNNVISAKINTSIWQKLIDIEKISIGV